LDRTFSRSDEIRALLVGTTGGGGEEMFLSDLAADPPGGVEYTLVKAHHESAPGARSQRFAEIAFNQTVHRFLRPLPGLKAYRVDDRFDLVHVHNHPLRLQTARPIPVVLSLGGSGYSDYLVNYLDWTEDRANAVFRRGRRAYRVLGISSEAGPWHRLAGISVFSRYARDRLATYGVPGDLIDVIPPGFPLLPAIDRRGRSGPFTFLFAGRDPHRKGADLVIDAIRRLRRDGVKVQGLLMGDESFSELRGEPGFDYFGVGSRELLLSELYPRADALAMPSRAEGYGFTVVEAMSFGLPVVTTQVSALPEIVGNAGAGVLVPPGDGEAVYEAMGTLARDRPAAVEMGKIGRARFEELFTRERFLKGVGAWYDRVLAGS
jgi:glycosyltransferase involved in cell wall biosynthesis